MIDKGEEDTLNVTEDLAFDTEACRTSAADTKREIDHLQRDYDDIQKEYDALSSQDIQSSTSKASLFTTAYLSKLNEFLNDTNDSIAELSRVHGIMNRKVCFAGFYSFICILFYTVTHLSLIGVFNY
jgi:hypothetical protein